MVMTIITTSLALPTALPMNLIPTVMTIWTELPTGNTPITVIQHQNITLLITKTT